MNRRRLIGALTTAVSLIALVTYTYLLFLAKPEVQNYTLKITVFVIVVVFLSIFIALGLGLLRTPSIPPIREHLDDVCTEKNGKE